MNFLSPSLTMQTHTPSYRYMLLPTNTHSYVHLSVCMYLMQAPVVYGPTRTQLAKAIGRMGKHINVSCVAIVDRSGAESEVV